MGFKVKDIAERLNLSSATVSLVVNNKPGISEATRQRVYKALEELGYKDILSEIRAEKNNIHFIVFRKKSNASSDTKYFSQVFSGIMEGVDVQAKELGYHLMITYMDEENIKEQITYLTQNLCEGILLLATDMEQKYLKMFTKTKIPLIILDNYYETEDADCVSINNEQGVFQAISHFKQMGHTKVGYIHSTVDVHNFSERYHGFLRAMEKCGLTVIPEYIFRLQADTDHMQEDLTAYFKTSESLPSAFFADNDIIAIHAVKALKNLNIRVPEDMSIIGFDNMPLSEMIDPPLTTIDVPKRRMGMMAVNRLIEIMKTDSGENFKLEIGTKLIIRKSVSRFSTINESDVENFE